MEIDHQRYGSIADLNIKQVGSDVVISYSHSQDAGSVTLENLQISDLDASQFLFS